jgi:hypothetical protein
MISQDNMQADELTPDRILDIGFAFWKSKALLSAVELDLFTALGDDRRDCGSLAGRLGLHPRGARDFLDALVALGLLDRDEHSRYLNRRDCAAYLDRRKPTYLGGQLGHLNMRLYPSWGLLTEALRTGLPQSASFGAGGYAALYAQQCEADAFLSGMTGGGLLAARALAARFPWKDCRSFIDVGTAQGGMPVEIARTHPHLIGGGFDLPQVEPAFTAHVREHGLADRLRFYGGDFHKDNLPSADVLIMGRILHNWDLPTKKLLLQKAHCALPRGGTLIVCDALIDPDRRKTAHALLASLNMLIETTGGFEYTGAECMGWMEESGFHQMRTISLAGGLMAVLATKPAA